MSMRLNGPVSGGRRFALPGLICFLAIVLMSSCGSGGSGSTPTPPPVNNAKADHVVLVVLENTSYSEVVGSANAPYFNSLIPQGTLATNYYADTHPSIGNYFMLTTGGVVTNNDSYTGSVAAPEMATELTGAGKSWKIYAEGIPSAGYTGGNTGSYLKRHDPFAFFSDVAGTASAANILPFPQFASDATETLPDFTMLVGNIYDVGHNCAPTVKSCTTAIRVQQMDAWLKATLPQVLSNASFTTSGLLVVTFDEAEDSDTTNGGGHVATVLLGSNVKTGYQAEGMYQHESLLRLMLEAQNVSSLPGASAQAASMDEVWK